MKNVNLNELARTKPQEPVLEHEIQIRAFELYEQRGGGQGYALEDWLKAEAAVIDRCYPTAYS
jgi:hypothetical protein